MKLLVTGVAGFIGSKIAKEAALRGYNVYGVDDLSQGCKENIPDEIKFIKLDLSDKNQFNMLPDGIEVILHLAGQSSGEISFDDPVADLRKNTISTLNLIEYGIAQKAKKIIYASSMAVYGHVGGIAVSEHSSCFPLSCYGVGKLASEKYLNIYKEQLPFVVFRMFNVYGPGQDMNNLRQGMVSIFLQHALTKGHISVRGSTERYRDFIYIDDVVQIWLQAIDNKFAINKIFNLGTGITTTIKNLLYLIKNMLPRVSWSEELGTSGDQFGVCADVSLLKEVFRVENFTSLEQGLEIFINSLKKRNYSLPTI